VRSGGQLIRVARDRYLREFALEEIARCILRLKGEAPAFKSNLGGNKATGLFAVSVVTFLVSGCSVGSALAEIVSTSMPWDWGWSMSSGSTALLDLTAVSLTLAAAASARTLSII